MLPWIDGTVVALVSWGRHRSGFGVVGCLAALTKGSRCAAGIAVSCAALAMGAAGCSSPPPPVAATSHPVRLAAAVIVAQQTGTGGTGYCLPALHELPVAGTSYCDLIGARLAITGAQRVDVVAAGQSGFMVELGTSAAQKGAFAAFMKRMVDHVIVIAVNGTVQSDYAILQPPSDLSIPARTRGQAMRLWRQLTGQR
jgi:hypothetical protein